MKTYLYYLNVADLKRLFLCLLCMCCWRCYVFDMSIQTCVPGWRHSLARLLSTFHLVLILFGRLCLVALCTLLWPCIYRFYIWRHCSCACDIGHSHNGIMTLLVDFTIHLTTGVEWLVLAIAELVFTSSVQRTLQFVDI